MKIPIVDKDDHIIVYKEREEVDYSSDIFRTASLWITNNRGDILLAQRKFDKKVDPGKWAEAVGGTVEGEDSYVDTVLREAEEELGLSGVIVKEGPKQFITSPCDYFVQWYSATVDLPIEAFTIQREEVEQIAWIPRSQLLEELRHNPEKYIQVMPEILALFP
ncbi:MAG TPA: NUDIX domain-containing protein [Candidatus Saccharimonadales bacterium]|nr:NUDIX domain-containing protein [Candidatus Saccharimonadales bacterium]